ATPVARRATLGAAAPAPSRSRGARRPRCAGPRRPRLPRPAPVIPPTPPARAERPAAPTPAPSRAPSRSPVEEATHIPLLPAPHGGALPDEHPARHAGEARLGGGRGLRTGGPSAARSP